MIAQNSPEDDPTRIRHSRDFHCGAPLFFYDVDLVSGENDAFVVRSRCADVKTKETLPHAQAAPRLGEPVLARLSKYQFRDDFTAARSRKTAREGFDFVAIWLLQRPFLRSRRQSPRSLMAAECWQPAADCPACLGPVPRRLLVSFMICISLRMKRRG